jgi:hypothetical protein
VGRPSVSGVWGRRVSSGGARCDSPPWVAVALAGVAVGHVLTYVIAVPHAHDRDVVLRATGHGYFPLFAQVAALAGALALGALFLSRLTRLGPLRLGPSSLFARLACAQAGAFAAMEVTERLVSDTPLEEFVRDHLFVGLLLQVLLAWVGARSIQALSRAAERARPSLGGRLHIRAVVSLVRPLREPIAPGFVPLATARAPPPVALAVH